MPHQFAECKRLDDEIGAPEWKQREFRNDCDAETLFDKCGSRRVLRSNSRTPALSSRCPISALNADCDKRQRCAATVKLRASHSARNACNCFVERFISIPEAGSGRFASPLRSAGS
jgi:hypothetical protein